MIRTTFKVTSVLAVLVLALVSLWAAFNPATAYAAGATATCGNNTTRSCTGVSCQAVDSSPGGTGYCSCTRADGTSDTKYCNDGPAMEENEY